MKRRGAFYDDGDLTFFDEPYLENDEVCKNCTNFDSQHSYCMVNNHEHDPDHDCDNYFFHAMHNHY